MSQKQPLQNQKKNQPKKPASPSEVRSRLEKALNKKSRGNIKNLIEYLLSNFVTGAELERAIKDNVNIIKLCLNHWELANPLVFPVFKTLLMMYWTEFEEYVTNVPKIWILLAKDEERQRILSTKEGIEYLNRCCEETYNFIYNIIWVLR